MALHGRPSDLQRDRPTQAVVDIGQFYRENYARFVRLAIQFVDTRDDAEDLVQDVFTRLVRNNSLQKATDPDTYTITAILNAARSALRKRRVRRLVALPPTTEKAGDAASGLAESGELARAITALPTRQRQVVVLRFYLDLDHHAIGKLLGISDSASASSLVRALRRLTREMGDTP